MIKGILFDMDGTLLDTENLVMQCTDTIGKKMGHNITRNFMLSLCGTTERHSRITMTKAFAPNFDYDVYKTLLYEEFSRYIEKNGLPEKPALKETIAALHAAGYKMAIASSNITTVIEDLLQLAGIRQYFSAIISGDMIENSKPAPDIFIKAAQELGFAPQECLAVEDSIHGVVSASDAGCITVMIPDLILPDDNMNRRCAAILRQLDELPPFLVQYNSEDK